MTLTDGLQLGPTTDDGKPIILVFPATEGWSSWFTSQGDNLENSKRGDGAAIDLSWTAEEDRGEKSVDLQFLEPIEVHDGEAVYKGDWSKADKLNLSVKIAANSVTPNANNTGNCNLVQGYIVVPAAGDGAYDINLATAVPIPTAVGQGFWDCNHETGVITPAAVQEEAAWILLAVAVETFVVRNVRLGSPLGIWDIDAYKVEWLHPTWKLHISVNKQSEGPGDFTGWLLMYRRNRT